MKIHDTHLKEEPTPTPFFEINDVVSKIPNKCCLSSSLMMSGAFVGYTLFLLLFLCHIGVSPKMVHQDKMCGALVRKYNTELHFFSSHKFHNRQQYESSLPPSSNSPSFFSASRSILSLSTLAAA